MVDYKDIIEKQREWLDKLQGIIQLPIRVKALAGKVPPGCDALDVPLYLWKPYPDIWDRLTKPIWTRGVLSSELCFDPDQKDWSVMKREMDKVLSFCEKNYIPYLLAYSGDMGYMHPYSWI